MHLQLESSALQAHLVLAVSALTSAYIAVARPTLSSSSRRRRRRSSSSPGSEAHTSPPATLYEAGTSPLLSPLSLAVFRGALAVYIFAMGAVQLSRLGTFVFKFYTIWNWWLLGLYFALAALASLLCARVEAKANSKTGAAVDSKRGKARAEGDAAGEEASGQQKPGQPLGAVAAPEALRRATPLARACHALFLINSSTVIIVDVVCWGVLYPMLARGPQSPEIDRVIRRLLLTFTSYNQHGLNALYIFADLFLNRQRLAFHAVGPLGLWSLLFAIWAHAWHAMTGKWLYPFLDTSKPWAPVAYLGLYLVHWMAFGVVALMYRIKAAVYGGTASVAVQDSRDEKAKPE